MRDYNNYNISSNLYFTFKFDILIGTGNRKIRVVLMPKIFTKNQKFKIVQYGDVAAKQHSFMEIANDFFCALKKMMKK